MAVLVVFDRKYLSHSDVQSRDGLEEEVANCNFVFASVDLL